MTFNPQQLAAKRPRNGSQPAQRANNHENVDTPAGDAATQAPESPESASPPAKDQSGTTEVREPDEVSIDIPLADPGTGYATGRIDFSGTPRQAAAAKMLAHALESRGERFTGGTSSHPDGTLVENANGAIRWLLDRVADGFEAETGKQLTQDFNLIFR